MYPLLPMVVVFCRYLPPSAHACPMEFYDKLSLFSQKLAQLVREIERGADAGLR